jgi:hypothetical protein
MHAARMAACEQDEEDEEDEKDKKDQQDVAIEPQPLLLRQLFMYVLRSSPFLPVAC